MCVCVCVCVLGHSLMVSDLNSEPKVSGCHLYAEMSSLQQLPG